MTTHYHVTAHVPECLNDTDLFPFNTITEARKEAANLAAEYYGEETHAVQIDRDTWEAHRNRKRYEQGYSQPYIIAVEPCTETECLADDAQY